jgi:dihydroneopterin aldolase
MSGAAARRGPADRIVLRGLALEARLGVYDWEQTAPQPILLELSFEPPANTAATSDALADTVDYAQVVARLRQLALHTPCQLVERMAEGMASALLQEFGLRWLRLELVKLAPIPGAQVGIVIEREASLQA